MLSVAILNDQPALNNYFIVDSVNYIAGETVVINFQFSDPEVLIRFIPGTLATCTVTFKLSDGTNLVKTATMLYNPDDRSIWTVTLSSSESLQVIGSSFLASLDVVGDASNIQQAIATNVMSKTFFDGEC